MLEQNIAPASAANAGTPHDADAGRPFRFPMVSAFPSKQLILVALLSLFCQSHFASAAPNAFESQNVSPQVDPYLQERNQSYAREQQELYRMQVPLVAAMGEDIT